MLFEWHRQSINPEWDIAIQVLTDRIRKVLNPEKFPSRDGIPRGVS